MSGLKTLLLALVVLGPVSVPARASDDLLRTFSVCAGRLSAQMEHQWLMQDPEAERTEQVRAAMLELVSLVGPDEATRAAALNIRVSAKHAQSLLLARATFNADAADAAWARRRAEDEIAACASLLLG